MLADLRFLNINIKMTTKTLDRIYLGSKTNPIILNTADGGYLNVNSKGETAIKKLNLPKSISGIVQADGTTSSDIYYCTKSSDAAGVLYSLFVQLPATPAVVVTPMLNTGLLSNSTELFSRFTVIETVTSVILTNGQPGYRINIRFIKCTIPLNTLQLVLAPPDSTTFNFIATTNIPVEL